MIADLNGVNLRDIEVKNTHFGDNQGLDTVFRIFLI